ncbi:MAG: hypothetical protein OES46_03375 [Gammaproteobacteria bacterium]|jgi:hypothetical protein|nr:hypothetical protein [Gammaproteobacteria bacterium]
MVQRSQIIQSFVARIWLERGANGDPKWRGHIQHIQGQEEIYFQDLAEVGEFLEQVSGISGPGFVADPGKKIAIPKRSAVASKKRKPDKRRNN